VANTIHTADVMSSISKPGPGDFVTVAMEDDVHEGSMLGVAVSGNAILLSKIGGKIYAVDAVCSHYNGYLPKGELKAGSPSNGGAEDHAIVCPVHKAQFEATTGKVLKNVPALLKLATHKEATDLRTYEVEVVDNSVRLRV
jgi:nitrite reductase/ring-hydroxylating ferredoxin subunit